MRRPSPVRSCLRGEFQCHDTGPLRCHVDTEWSVDGEVVAGVVGATTAICPTSRATDRHRRRSSRRRRDGSADHGIFGVVQQREHSPAAVIGHHAVHIWSKQHHDVRVTPQAGDEALDLGLRAFTPPSGSPANSGSEGRVQSMIRPSVSLSPEGEAILLADRRRDPHPHGELDRSRRMIEEARVGVEDARRRARRTSGSP